MTPMTAGRRAKRQKRNKRDKREERENSPRRARLPRNRRATMIVTLSAIALVLYSVIVPVHVSLYASPVPVTMLLAAAAVTAALVSIRYPNTAMVLFTVAAVLVPLTISREA